MFAFQQDNPEQDAWPTWRYRTLTLRLAREMVATGEAVKIQVFDQDNGWFPAWRETRPFEATYVSPTCLSAATSRAMSMDRAGEQLSRRDRREIESFIMHPFSHDTKAPLVGNRVDDAHRRRAEKLIYGRPSQAEHSRRDREVRTWRAQESTAA